MVVECANYSKHGIPTGWFASREFKLDDDELRFMNQLSREDQRRIWKVHFDTGRCVACLIDEWKTLNRFPTVELEEVLEGASFAGVSHPDLQKPAPVYGEYNYRPSRDVLIQNKIQEIFDETEDNPSVLQRLIQLILEVERYLASCFSKKKED